MAGQWMFTRRSLLECASAIGGAALMSTLTGRFDRAFAAWPERPIKLLAPFAPAGPVDQVARVIATPLGEVLGTTVYIENRAGAGGNIGIANVARSDPDGYTLLVCSSAFMLNPSLYETVAYDPIKDFAPIAEMATSPNVFVVDPKLGVNTMADLAALAKKDPDRLNYASPGTGTTPQLSAELFKIRAGIKITHVVFNGAGPAIQAILAGTVPIACTALPPAHPHIVAGTLKALAVTGEKRWFDLPHVPTMAEAGFQNFVHDTTIILAAPARTPPEVVERVAKEVVAILKRPAVRGLLQKAGFEVLANGPEQLRARVAKEVPMWREVVAQAGIKIK